MRDGVSGQTAQRGELEKRLANIKLKDQRGDVVTFAHLCRSLDFLSQSLVVVG